MVMMEYQVQYTAASQIPSVHNQMPNFSRDHINPELISVTEAVDSDEEVKGGAQLERQTSKRSDTVRPIIAVFVCCCLGVACLLIAFIIYFTYAKEETKSRLDIDIKESWYVRRDAWQALPESGIGFLKLPVDHVLIGHSKNVYSTEKYACIREVFGIQSDHLRRGWNDIGPNYLVCGNGMVFEGRGANVLGAMVRFWNMNSISVMFLGDYSRQTPSKVQLQHVSLLLDELVRLKVLKPDYIVYGHCQVLRFNTSPGRHLVENLHNFGHWRNVNTSNCVGFDVKLKDFFLYCIVSFSIYYWYRSYSHMYRYM